IRVTTRVARRRLPQAQGKPKSAVLTSIRAVDSVISIHVYTPIVSWASRSLLVVAGLAVAATAHGQELPPLTIDGRTIPVDPAVITVSKAGVVVRATRINAPLHVDGILDEEFYGQVQPITEFQQQDPHEGAAVSERTEAWVLYDDRFIYAVCRCWDE